MKYLKKKKKLVAYFLSTLYEKISVSCQVSAQEGFRSVFKLKCVFGTGISKLHCPTERAVCYMRCTISSL